MGNVEFYAGPHDTGGPDNLEEIIVGFINGAQKRLEVAVQELESRPIADVLIAARRRKVLVKLVIEQDYLKRTRSKDDPWTPGGKNENNRSVHNAILRASIDVKVDYNTSIFHQKFIVRDRQSVLTGSTNFTPAGIHNNLNHIVVIHNEKLAKIYSGEFREILWMISGRQKPEPMRKPLLTCLCKRTRRNTSGRPLVWKRIGKNCWPFMIFRHNTGKACVLPTRTLQRLFNTGRGVAYAV